MLREAIQHIRTNRRSRSKRREAVHAPTKRDGDPVERVLQRLPEEHQTRNAHDPGRVDTPETHLGFELAVVRADVAVLQEIVEPVAPELGDDGADHGREVEEGGGGLGEVVWWRPHEETDCRDDADGPHGDDHDEARGCEAGQ